MSQAKVILVTGGNRGLGLAACRQFAALGHAVLLGSRSPAAGSAAAQSIGGEGIEPVSLDVTSQPDIDALRDYIEARHGRLDVLVNNAGVMIDGNNGASTSICVADIGVIERSLEINSLAPIRLINALLPLLGRSDDARIVNLSSGMGQLSDMGGNYPGYRLSKTALNAVTRIYAAELDPTRFSVNSVCPGWVRTDMGGADAELAPEEGVDTVVWLATAAEARSSGGFYRQRKPIDW
jgi:NAD(P)-dependent dehydrogenase (short-subunit alcohol dehydrogenase family)